MLAGFFIPFFQLAQLYMMNRFIISLVFSILAIPTLTSIAQADDLAQQQNWVKEARSIIKKLNHRLKKTRKQGLSEGGEVKAVEACHLDAPDIASDLSDPEEWTIRRTTLKTRGLDNAPDKWEISVLKKFKQRHEKGELKKKPDYFEVVENKEGKPVFRYMKAITIKRACLKCHGKHIARDVASQLASLYPFDLATGYKKGDLRGAYTLTLAIDNSKSNGIEACKSPSFLQQGTCWKPLASYQACQVDSIKKQQSSTVFCPENKISRNSKLPGYQFLSVEDGDTIVIDFNNKKQRVQLIGIDAPENTINPKINLDASRKQIGISYLLEMGNLATKKLNKLLKNNPKVYLQGDLTKTDKYGRLPALVINEKGESLNLKMVETGYALLLTRFPIDDKLRESLKQAQNQAKIKKRGLWKTHAELMQKWSN